MSESHWLQCWLRTSPHNHRQSVYQALTRAAEVAFCRESAGHYVKDVSVADPPFRLIQRQRISSPERLRSILGTIEALQTSLGWLALQMVCEAEADAYVLLAQHCETMRSRGVVGQSSEDSIERIQKVAASLTESVADIIKPLRFKGAIDFADGLCSTGALAKIVTKARTEAGRSLFQKRGAPSYEPVLVEWSRRILKLNETCRETSRWGCGEPLSSTSGLPRAQELPLRSEIAAFAAKVSELMEDFSGADWPRKSAAISDRIAASLKKIDQERALCSFEALRQNVLEHMQSINDQTSALQNQREAFIEVNVDFPAAPTERDDWLRGLINDVQSHRDSPLLARLLVDSFAGATSDGNSFDDLFESTILLYLKPGQHGAKFRERLRGRKSEGRAALAHYVASFKASDCWSQERSSRLPVAQHFVARIWHLASLFKAASDAPSSEQRNVRTELIGVLIGMLVCRHSNKDVDRWDYLEALRHIDGEAMKSKLEQEIDRLFDNLEKTYGWDLSGSIDLSNQISLSSLQLTNEEEIHTQYFASPSSYPPQHQINLIADLPQVTFVKFAPGKSRPKKAAIDSSRELLSNWWSKDKS